MDNTEKTIDIKSLYFMIIKHIKLIIALTVIFALGALIIFTVIVPKKYTSSIMLYVQSNEVSGTVQQQEIGYQDIQAAEKLAGTCQILFTSEKMINYILEDLKNDYGITNYTSEDISEWITVTAPENTAILTVSVETTDPDLSAAVAQSIDLNAHSVYSSVVDAGIVKEVVPASVPDKPSSPNVQRDTAIGLIIGLVLGCIISIVIEMVDTKIKPSDDLLALYGIPVFAEIVDFEANVKGGYDYEYRNV